MFGFKLSRLARLLSTQSTGVKRDKKTEDFEMLCGFKIILKKQDVILYYKQNDFLLLEKYIHEMVSQGS